MALSLQQIAAVHQGLGQIGVSREDIFRLLDACDQNPELVLCTVDLELPPREGDRIRAKLASGEKSLRVEAVAMSKITVPKQPLRLSPESQGVHPPLPVDLHRYAIVGLPIEASSRDDLVIEKVHRA